MKCLFNSFFIFLSFFVSAQSEQTDSISLANAKKQGNIMAKLLLEKNYKEFAKYTYPSIIKMSGGEENMITLIKKSITEMEEKGYSFINFSVEKPLNIIHLKNSLQCAITENIEMKIPNGRLTSKATLLGISNDKGENWTFIDTHGSDLKSLQKTIPELSNDLIIPEKQQPVFYKE